MRIGILGGGFAGLTAAYRLAKNGHEVTIFERGRELGGLAVGIKNEGWQWYLERAIHHIFSNDSAIIELAGDTGFKNVIFKSPLSASLYEERQNYRIIPVDTPQDFLNFPYLNMVDKLRAGAVIASLKLSPFLPIYEQITAEAFLRLTMGERSWYVLWETLFRKKFGKYAGNIMASFIWARIKKRTKTLGYFEGGFQTFITHLEHVCDRQKVAVKKGCGVIGLSKKQDQIAVHFRSGEEGRATVNTFDRVISTLPTPVLLKVATDFFPQNYLKGLGKIEYLHAVSLILETKDPYLEKAYWVNMCSKTVPMTLLAQHTNFMDKKYYGGKHIAYVGWYVERSDKLISMSEIEVYDVVKKSLGEIAGKHIKVLRKSLFKGPFAQPIFNKTFITSKPDFETPVKNFYIANLDMTYPYDRGTNYAVDLGNKVANLIGA